MPPLGPRATVRRPRRPRSTSTAGPRSEAAAGGGYGIQKAATFKRTAPYRGAVRAAYTAQPTVVRSQQARQAKRAPISPDAAAIIKTHADRVRGLAKRKHFEATFTGLSEYGRQREQTFQRQQDVLSKANQERVYNNAQALALRGQHNVAGNNPELNAMTAYASPLAAARAVQAGEVNLGPTGLGKTVRPPEAIAKERAMTKLAVDASKAGASMPQITKALTALDKRHKAPELTVLEQFHRPISAVAGGFKGGLKGAVKGAISNKEDFSKILKDAGYGKGVSVGAGLVLDIALDPTTYLSFGAGRPALSAARTAAEQAARRALDQGLEHAAVEAAAHSAAEHAFAAHGAKGVGIKVGLRGAPVRIASTAKNVVKGQGLREAVSNSTREVMSSGATSSRLVGTPAAKVTGAVAKRLPERVKTDLDQIGQSLIHSYRPRGFTPVQWERMRSSARRYRAGMSKAERVGETRMQVYRHDLQAAKVPAERHAAIIDAVEVRDVGRLPEHERPIAEAMLRDAESMAQAEVKTGVRKPGAVVQPRGPSEFLSSPDVAESRKALHKTRRAAASAEREVRAAETDLGRMQGRSEILSRNVGGRRAEVAAMRAYRENRIPLAPKSQEAAPAVPPGHVRLYRGEGVVRWSREDWPDAPESATLSHGRWFTEDPERAKGYATSAGRKGYVRYVDVPEDVAHAHRVPGEKSTFVLPDDMAKAAAELEPGAGRAAMHEHINQTAAAERAPEIRARRRAAKEALQGHRAGGDVGVAQARQRLAEAQAKRANALEALAARTEGHAGNVALAREARAARRQADKLSQEATGYVARYTRGDLTPDEALRVYRTEPGGRKVASTSLRQRKERLPLAEQAPENRARLIQDIPTIMGERTAEGERLRTLSKFNDQMAAHGTPVEHPDQIDLLVDHTTGLPDPLDMQRFYLRGPRGDLTPVWRTVDRVDQLQGRLHNLVESGQHVVEVPRTTVEAMWGLAKRGRVTRAGAKTELPTLFWDNATRKWKWLVTQPNPGYHVRNLIGDAWNARLGGATTQDMGAALRMISRHRKHLDGLSKDMLRGVADDVTPEQLQKIGRTERYGANGDLSDGEVLLLAEQHGAVRAGQIARELRDLRRGTAIKARGRAGRTLQTFSESREDLMRLASFRRALKRGDNPEAAAAWANKHHFDYSDLTDVEVRALRRVMPFYTWMARNTPRQLASLLQTPGRFASLEKVRRASAEAAGLPQDWALTMPEYVQASAPLAMPSFLPGAKQAGLPMLASASLPVTDINNVTPHMLAAKLAQSVSPFFKLPTELFAKYDFYYRDKIRKDLVPAPIWVADANNQKLLRSAVGALPGVGKPTFDYITDRRTGKRVIAWPWWMDKLARQTPMSGVVTGLMTQGRERRPGDKLTSLTNWLTGVRRQTISPSEARTSQLFEDLKNVEKEIGLAGERRTGKPGSPHAGKLKELDKRRAQIQSELNLATTDFAAPYFPSPARKKKAAKFGQTSASSHFGSGNFGKPSGPRFGSGQFGSQ